MEYRDAYLVQLFLFYRYVFDKMEGIKEHLPSHLPPIFASYLLFRGWCVMLGFEPVMSPDRFLSAIKLLNREGIIRLRDKDIPEKGEFYFDLEWVLE